MYFLLLVLGIPLNLSPDIGYKRGGFSKILLEKGFKFVPSKKGGLVTLNLCFVLLPMEVDPIPEQKSRKENALMICGTGHVEMILALSTKIVALHVQASIIQVRVMGLKGFLLGGRICWAMFLAFYKQFSGQPDDFLQVYIGVYIRRA